MFRGRAATGKTTLSNALARELQVTVLHKDDLYDAVAAHIGEHSVRNQICFDVLRRVLQSSLDHAVDIVIDFGHNHLDDAEQLKAWIEERGGELSAIAAAHARG